MRNISDKVVDRVTTHSNFFFRKSYLLSGNVEKCGIAGMRIACWMMMATDTHGEYFMFFAPCIVIQSYNTKQQNAPLLNYVKQ